MFVLVVYQVLKIKRNRMDFNNDFTSMTFLYADSMLFLNESYASLLLFYCYWHFGDDANNQTVNVILSREGLFFFSILSLTHTLSPQLLS